MNDPLTIHPARVRVIDQWGARCAATVCCDVGRGGADVGRFSVRAVAVTRRLALEALRRSCDMPVRGAVTRRLSADEIASVVRALRTAVQAALDDS